MGGGTLETAEGPAAGSVSVLAVDHFVAAAHEAVVEVVSAVGLDVAAAVVDDHVVAGTADEVGRGDGVGAEGGSREAARLADHDPAGRRPRAAGPPARATARRKAAAP